MKRAHLFAFQIAFTMLYYFCTGNIFAQNKVKQSLYFAGNTASQQPQQYKRFISELTKLNHPYSFIYLGNFASFNQVDKELDFSFYPENIQKLPGFFGWSALKIRTQNSTKREKRE
jgi:hypothetical protein